MNEEFFKEMTSFHIKEMRLKTGLTQEEFCEYFGINLNTFRHWERGDRKPTGSSLVLLNMIESSGAEVLRILSNTKNTEVSMSEGKNLLISVFEKRALLSFESYVTSDEFSLKAVLSLLKANGFPYVTHQDKRDEIIFFAGYESNTLRNVLSVNLKEKTYTGEFKKIIEKTYLVVYAFEEELRDAVFWTPSMRKSRVEEILKRINIDNEFYKNVLRNW
ncbi:helix-turn-helix domain-containing protein [Pectobacterium zantedeschiae]|uniref:helix-turn-helix domain-containing protein n=1 Tax=Pectobacterium zantedeschiae TaxID=2034769 RepID=UPI0037542B4C